MAGVEEMVHEVGALENPDKKAKEDPNMQMMKKLTASPSTTPGPEGNYKVVAFALDLSGNKLIDGICSIAAYSVEPEYLFAQNVLPDPDRSITPSANRKHGLNTFVSTCGVYITRIYRNLMGRKGNVGSSSKSEYVSLDLLINWLYEVKTSTHTDGIILAYHGTSSLNDVGQYLLESLDKYKMTNEFFQLVRGFVNVHTVVEHLLEKKGPLVTSLRQLANTILGRKINDGFLNAIRKATLTHEVLSTILKTSGSADTKRNDIEYNDLKEYFISKRDVMRTLLNRKILVRKAKSLRPLFFGNPRTMTRREHERLSILWQHLVEIAMDYRTLRKAFDSGQSDAIEQIIRQCKKGRKDEDELLKIIVEHFYKQKPQDSNFNVEGYYALETITEECEDETGE